jgi:preprotein translocase subunit SecA
MKLKEKIFQINSKEIELKNKSDEELNNDIEKLKKRCTNESLDILLPDWFSLVKEISYRTIGLKHYDKQLEGGILLHEGKIVEMKTGEGKTLVGTLPVSLNALLQKGVHVVTVNDYLAERDQKWMGKIFKQLGLSVGLIKSDSKIKQKQESYKADITYITNSELVFDYLRDNTAYELNEMVQRPFSFCLIDEIDSILIDESRTPLILSEPKGTEDISKLRIAQLICEMLIKDIDFEIDEKKKDINLTEFGYKKIKQKLGKKFLYDSTDSWLLEILNALKATHLFKANKDYIKIENKIYIVDEFTGRIMNDRRWSMGLHEAIEIKEKVPVREGTKTKTSITYQNFFPLFPKLAGMTGTAKTNEREFKEIYNLSVEMLDTVKPLIRKDLDDLLYQNETAKWEAVLVESKKCFEKGQPLLIGTASIEKSEFLSELFNIAKIPHQLLNAKPENLKRENEIIAQAGKKYAVTIATNMAGRGTDIILGGNIGFEAKKKIIEIFEKKNIEEEIINKIYEEYKDNKKNLLKDINNLPYSLENCKKNLKNYYENLYKQISLNWEKENEIVKNLGGLFVLGTERHETRRIDNQLRGRAGRQGDPGVSQFFVSLDDDLMKIFGGENFKNWINSLSTDQNEPLVSDFLTTSLENAQKKVENYNYEIRKNIFLYDTIINYQRKEFFKGRNQMLYSIGDIISLKNIFENYFLPSSEEFLIKELLKKITDKKKLKIKVEKNFQQYSFYSGKKTKKLKKKNLYKELWISQDLKMAKFDSYQLGFLKDTLSFSFFSLLDFYWTEHLERINYIRETINWRAYGQQNPLIEYNEESRKSFKEMFTQIRSTMIYSLLNPTFY